MGQQEEALGGRQAVVNFTVKATVPKQARWTKIRQFPKITKHRVIL